MGRGSTARRSSRARRARTDPLIARALGAGVSETERRCLSLAGDLLPPRVTRLAGNLAVQPTHDHDVLDRRGRIGGSVGGLLHRNDLSATVEAVRADKDLGVSIA